MIMQISENQPLCASYFYVGNKALHSTNQNYSELSFSNYQKSFEIITLACVMLWRRGKLLGSIYLFDLI